MADLDKKPDFETFGIPEAAEASTAPSPAQDRQAFQAFAIPEAQTPKPEAEEGPAGFQTFAIPEAPSAGFRAMNIPGAEERAAAITPPGMTSKPPSQSVAGAAWNWLWEPRYNEIMDFLGAPPSWHYTGKEDEAVQNYLEKSIGGTAGHWLGGVAGGITHGVLDFLNSQSSIGALALLIGSFGESGLGAAAGRVALGETTARTVGEEALARIGKSGLDLAAKVFSPEDIAEIAKGVQISDRARKLGQSVDAALAEANINKKLLGEGINVLHQVGLGEKDLFNRGLLVNGGRALLRTFGVPLKNADNIGKLSQAALDSYFGVRNALGAFYQFPSILAEYESDPAKATGDFIGMLPYMGMGYLGVRQAGLHAGEVFGQAAEKAGLGFFAPSTEAQEMRKVLGGFQLKGTQANRLAEILYNTKNKEYAPLDVLDRWTARVLLESGFDKDEVIKRYNYLAESAGRSNDRIESKSTNKETATPDERDARYADLAKKEFLKYSKNYNEGNLGMLLDAYKRAMDPSEKVTALARWTQGEFLKAVQEAALHDVHINTIEDYITNLWAANKDNPYTQELLHDLRFNPEFHTNVSMLMQRTFANAFEGELLGRRLAITDPIYLVARYKARMGEMVAAREALDELRDKGLRAFDGRKFVELSGAGREAQMSNGENPTLFIDGRRIRDVRISGAEIKRLQDAGELDSAIKQGKIHVIYPKPKGPDQLAYEFKRKELTPITAINPAMQASALRIMGISDSAKDFDVWKDMMNASAAQHGMRLSDAHLDALFKYAKENLPKVDPDALAPITGSSFVTLEGQVIPTPHGHDAYMASAGIKNYKAAFKLGLIRIMNGGTDNNKDVAIEFGDLNSRSASKVNDILQFQLQSHPDSQIYIEWDSDGVKPPGKGLWYPNKAEAQERFTEDINRILKAKGQDTLFQIDLPVIPSTDEEKGFAKTIEEAGKGIGAVRPKAETPGAVKVPEAKALPDTPIATSAFIDRNGKFIATPKGHPQWLIDHGYTGTDAYVKAWEKEGLIRVMRSGPAGTAAHVGITLGELTPENVDRVYNILSRLPTDDRSNIGIEWGGKEHETPYGYLSFKNIAEARKLFYDQAEEQLTRVGRLYQKVEGRGAEKAAPTVPIHEDIAKNLKENDGVTWGLKDGNRGASGLFAVSMYPERTQRFDAPPTPQEVEKFIEDNRELLQHKENAVGGWKDPKTGKYYLDVTSTVKGQDTAEALGKKYNQISITHLNGKDFPSIDTGGTGELIAGLPPIEDRIHELRDLEKAHGELGPEGEAQANLYRGIQPALDPKYDLVLFHDPKYGITLSLPKDQMTVEAVKTKMEDAIKRFEKEKAAGSNISPNTHAGKLLKSLMEAWGPRGLTPEQAMWGAATWNARARLTGVSREEYFNSRLESVQRGSPKDITAIPPERIPDVRALVDFKTDGKAIMRGMKSADFGSFVHESLHIFRRDLAGDDLKIMEKACKVVNGKWEPENEEDFVKLGNQWLKEGRDVSTPLGRVMAKFTDWMREIYTSLLSYGVKLNDDTRGVFNRLLDIKEEDLPSKEFMTEDEALLETEAKAHLGEKIKPESAIPDSVDRMMASTKDAPIYLYNTHDYRTVDHPAFRDWNFAAYTEDGTRVLVRGELRVHPDAYKYVTRMLGLEPSPLRELPVVSSLLKVGGQAKQLLLFGSPFHIAQLGLRSIMTGIMPRLVNWNLEGDEDLQGLVRHGQTMGHRFGEEAEFQDGLVASTKGLLGKVPLVRDYQNWLQKFTFERLLPSLKALAGKKMFAWWYGKFTSDKPFYEKYILDHEDFAGLDPKEAAYRAAAQECNERFGGLNYRDFGRSAGMQDFAKMVVLAPDWMESELRLAKRLFDPTGGKLLRRDMIYMTAGLWITARIANQLLTGNPHPEAPFGVVLKDKEDKNRVYSLRTLPTDILHMADDPVGFLRGRTAPVTKTASEAVVGRDQFGRKLVDWNDYVDLGRNILPIPLQSAMRGHLGDFTQPFSSREQVIKALGGTVAPLRSEAAKKSIELASSHSEEGRVDPNALRRHQSLLDYENLLHNGKLGEEDIHHLYDEGQISSNEAKAIIKTNRETSGMDSDMAQLYRMCSHLGLPELLQVWSLMSDHEKAAMSDMLSKKKKAYKKRAEKNMTPAERRQDPTYQWIRQTFPQETPWD
jgi:hypothetical protein